MNDPKTPNDSDVPETPPPDAGTGVEIQPDGTPVVVTEDDDKQDDEA